MRFQGVAQHHSRKVFTHSVCASLYAELRDFAAKISQTEEGNVK